MHSEYYHVCATKDHNTTTRQLPWVTHEAPEFLGSAAVSSTAFYHHDSMISVVEVWPRPTVIVMFVSCCGVIPIHRHCPVLWMLRPDHDPLHCLVCRLWLTRDLVSRRSLKTSSDNEDLMLRSCLSKQQTPSQSNTNYWEVTSKSKSDFQQSSQFFTHSMTTVTRQSAILSNYTNYYVEK